MEKLKEKKKEKKQKKAKKKKKRKKQRKKENRRERKGRDYRKNFSGLKEATAAPCAEPFFFVYALRRILEKVIPPRFLLKSHNI